MNAISIGDKVRVTTSDGYHGSEGTVSGRCERGSPRPWIVLVTKLVWIGRQRDVAHYGTLTLHTGDFEPV